MSRRFGFLAGLLLIVCSSVFSAVAQDNLQTFFHDGFERSYALHLPTTFPAGKSLPLVIALHQTASSGRALEAISGLNAASDEYGFAVAYPNSNTLRWNDGRPDAPGTAAEVPADDLGFIEALIEDIARSHNIDPEQVFLAGMGGGGTLAYSAACTFPEKLAGVIVVGALLWDYHTEICAEQQTPVKLLILHGSADTFYGPQGQRFANQFDIYGVQETIHFWSQHNACESESESPGAHLRLFLSCREDKSVALYSMTGVGQNWPRGDELKLNQFGIDANEIIARFIMDDESWMEAAPDVNFDGIPRTYIVYVPTSYDPAQPMPLVLGLHGRTSNGVNTAASSGMNFLAEKYGFIAVYPDGLNGEWNYVREIPIYDYGDHDDVAFLSSLIDDLSLGLNINQDRVYAFGISNGGFMVQRLACEAPERFAAFASVIAQAYWGLDPFCEGQPPVPIMFINGTEDPIVSWEGLQRTNTEGQQVSVIFSTEETLEFWGIHNRCIPDFDHIELPQLGASPQTEVHRFDYEGCAEGSALRIYAVVGGGHTWPGIDWGNEALLGRTNYDIEAGEEIWQFFAEHPG